MTENNINIVDKIVIVHPFANTWKGRKKLDPSDLGGVNPPEDLISLGNKRIVPKTALRPFESLKKRLDRTLMKYGVRLIGGYAVAEENLGVLTEKLQEFEVEFNRMKDDFIRDFDQHVEEQVQAYPEWTESLQAAAAEVKPHLDQKFRCGYKAYKLVPPGSDSESENAFVKDEEIIGQACSEVAAMADKVLMKLSCKEELKQTFLRFINKIREKLLNLASLDRNLFGGMVRVTDNVLGQMPSKGPIQGVERKKLASLLFLTRNLPEATVRDRLFAGEFDDPEALMRAMGYDVDAAQTSDMPEEEEEREVEEIPWF